jgi:Domain of unknown function (DUF6933)
VVLLRATQKILRSLPPSVDDAAISGNALGDWYVNRIVIDRKPLLLIVSSKSLLSILAPARDLKALPDRLAMLVEKRLRRLGVSDDAVASEVEATVKVGVGRTVDRSVVGQMVDFAKAIPFYLPINGWDEDTLPEVEDKLAETPCRSSRTDAEAVWPREKAMELIGTSWPSSRTRH